MSNDHSVFSLRGLGIQQHPLGWMLLGGIFAVTGVLIGPAVRWAERARSIRWRRQRVDS